MIGTRGRDGQLTPKADRPRWRRWIVRGAGAYVVVVVAGQIVLYSTVAVSRIFGDDPRTEFSGVPNFRIVDDAVWAGGQPFDERTYRKLAAGGVRLVVDLRTGAPDDANEDDPELLRSMGIDYLRMPVQDGHVPSDGHVEQLLDAVRNTDGVVLVHCGAGVGRSSSMTVAYERGIGDDARIADHLSVGLHTVEQVWFIVTGDTNPVVRRLSEAIDAPRRAWSRLRGAF